MPRFIDPVLMLIARATEKELVQSIEYLNAENRPGDRRPKRTGGEGEIGVESGPTVANSAACCSGRRLIVCRG